MSDEPAKLFEVNSDPSLSNAGIGGDIGSASFRNPVPSTSAFDNNAVGPPALPPRPDFGQQNYGMNQGYSYGGMGGYGYGGMGGYGMGGMGMSPYGSYNRYGMDMGMESRFVQMAEENSRPAFDSIQSFVNAVGSVAMMLENTFFALTSSYRAILGVAENFGRLRSLFAQFWSTFAVVRSLNWMVRKLLVLMGIRTECEFKAWAEAVAATQSGTATAEQRAKGSSWPILMFFGVVCAAPYLVLKMLSGLSSSINERLNDPATWQNPYRAVAQHDFQATTPQELSFSANQVLTVAPQHLQTQLWNSGWLMASTDRQTAGLVPTNYIKLIKPTNQIEGVQANETTAEKPTEKPTEPSVVDLNKFYGQEL